MPLIKASQHFNWTKFGVSNQQNSNSWWQKATNISQQCQLGGCSTMSTHLLYPRPGNRDGSSPISQRDHQQLMCKTHFRTIHNQFNLLKMGCLLSQPPFSNWLIPGTYINSWIFQQPTQAACKTKQLSRARYFACNSAQPHRSTLVNPNDQPSKIPYLCNSLPRSQFHYLMNPGIIELVGRHCFSPFRKMVVQKLILREILCRSTIYLLKSQVARIILVIKYHSRIE